MNYRGLLKQVLSISLIGILLIACQSTLPSTPPQSTLSSSPASQSNTPESPKSTETSMPTSQPNIPESPQSTEVSPPDTTENDVKITYGYVDSTPVVIVPPENEMRIKLHDITYITVNGIWVLGGYQVTIVFPSGKTTKFELFDFEYNENLSPVSYSASENGTSVSVPSLEDFNTNNIENGIGLYPGGYEVALFLRLPCSVASSNDEYTKEQIFEIWVDHISNHTAICKSGETYTFNFDEYTYMDKPSLKPSGVTLSVSVAK